MDRIKALAARVQATRPVRVFLHYGSQRGPILASGLAFQAIFAVFAAIWVGFSILGLVLSNDFGLRQAIIVQLGSAIPGLIKTGSGGGAIDPQVLLQPAAFSITGIVALIGLLVTALGWLASTRDAVRVVFGFPALKVNPVLLKLRDLGFGVGFAVIIILSTVLSFASTALTDTLLGWIGVDSRTPVAFVLSRVLTLAVMFVLDAVSLAGLFRILSALAIPRRALWTGAVVGAIGLGVLKVLGTSLLGGASKNPLLASFAVILGLLIFFNFVCQAILLSASWIVVGLRDRGVVIDKAFHDQQIRDAIVTLEGEGLAVGVPVERRGKRTRILAG